MKQRKQAKLHGSNRHEKDKRERAAAAVGLHSGLSGGKKIMFYLCGMTFLLEL